MPAEDEEAAGVSGGADEDREDRGRLWQDRSGPAAALVAAGGFDGDEGWVEGCRGKLGLRDKRTQDGGNTMATIEITGGGGI